MNDQHDASARRGSARSWSKRLYQCGLLFWALCVAESLPARGAAGTIGFPQLLQEMSDRSSLARWPEQEWSNKQSSAMKLEKRHNPGYFAEKEIGNYLRLEQNAEGHTETVLMEDKGPGVVMRIWVGNTEGNTNTILRMYFDGNARPSIKANLVDFVYGREFIKPPYAAERARGGNVYLPVPYAKACKITVENSKDLFYVIQYRAYDPKTRIETFDKSQYQRNAPRLEKTANALAKLSDDFRGSVSLLDQSLESRGSAEAKLRTGSRAVNYLGLKLEAKDLKKALRTTVLQVSFDGITTIDCPVGDFFGSGLGLNPLEDWMRSVKADGAMSCRWVMPYRKSATLRIRCQGEQPVKVKVRVNYQPWRWDNRSLYFHSTWGIHEKMGILPRPNFNFIHVEGRGVYVGETLSITTDSKLWWGEGPEKVCVDGEDFPSEFGTGSEDYFGYAWGECALFCAPFHSQNKIPEGPRWLGTTVNTRIRSLDAIPFKKSLNLDIEVQTHDSNGTVQKYVDYGVATYWYGSAGTKGTWIREPARMKP